MQKKERTHHQVLKYLLTERTVNCYSKLEGRNFQVCDSIHGQDGWCDFVDKYEWGECTNAYQDEQAAEYIMKNLFSLRDRQALEEQYCITIKNPSQHHSQVQEMGYLCNTRERVALEMSKKFKKLYRHAENGYRDKGTLLVGIAEMTFCGFGRDPEFRESHLKELHDRTFAEFQNSVFNKVLLVSALDPFHEDPSAFVYRLF